VPASQRRPKGLLVVGGMLLALGALGLGSTLWLGGPDPSLWFIISGSGRDISGWTITVAFVSALAASAWWSLEADAGPGAP
jgi:hypothetical protein